MKRDDDLLRSLMFEIEGHTDPLFLQVQTMGDGPAERARYFHLLLLVDAGFLEQINNGVFRMTNAGHDFLAVIRSDTTWARTKEAAKPLVGVSLGMMRDIAVGYLRQQLRDMGVPID